MEKNSLHLHFGGEVHSIDANTLVNTLIHYNALVTLINQEYGGGAKEINIRVNAPQKGSFILDISLIEGLKGLFSSRSVAYVADLLAILCSVFGIYKVFKGKPAKKEDIINQVNIQVNNTQVINAIVNVYNNRKTREAVSKAFETLDNDESVDGFDIITDNQKLSTPRTEFRELIYKDFDSEEPEVSELTSEEDATLVIVALNFEKGSVWSFIHKGSRLKMTVKDDALMEQIDNGMQFGKGDAIKVRLLITKRYNPEYRVYEIASHKIIRFYEQIKCEYKDPKLIDEE